MAFLLFVYLKCFYAAFPLSQGLQSSARKIIKISEQLKKHLKL